jgi:hypothetical protein
MDVIKQNPADTFEHRSVGAEEVFQHVDDSLKRCDEDFVIETMGVIYSNVEAGLDDFATLKQMLLYAAKIELQLHYVICLLMATNCWREECSPERGVLVEYARKVCAKEEPEEVVRKLPKTVRKKLLEFSMDLVKIYKWNSNSVELQC